MKKTGKKNSPPINLLRWGTEIETWVLICYSFEKRPGCGWFTLAARAEYALAPELDFGLDM